jgi:hypothetical protein
MGSIHPRVYLFGVSVLRRRFLPFRIQSNKRLDLALFELKRRTLEDEEKWKEGPEKGKKGDLGSLN